MVIGNYFPNIDAPVFPQISWESAWIVAKAKLGRYAAFHSSVRNRLVIYPHNNAFYLAWQLTFSTTNPFGNWIAFIDASTGKLLKLLDDTRSVDGKVTLRYPGYTGVSIQPLLRLNGGNYLEGTYAAVFTHRGSRATKSSGNFRFEPTTFENNWAIDLSGFDQANAYYHIDKFRNDYINGVLDSQFSLNNSDFTGGGHGSDQMKVYTHSTDIFPNEAQFRLQDKSIHVGDGFLYAPGGGYSRADSSNDFAKEAKIFYHEYWHAMHYYISDIQPMDDESGAISEGGPDYFAGAFAKNSGFSNYEAARILHWAINCAADPQNCIGRSMATPGIGDYETFLNNEPVEIHDGGEFWSAVLWDLRKDAGITETHADILVYEALYRITSSPSFLEYRDAMIAVDDSLDGGSHEATINSVFTTRGIGVDPPPAAPTGLTITNAGQIGRRVKLAWSANSEPDLNHYNVWRKCQYWRYFPPISCTLAVIATTTATTYNEGEVFIDVNDGSTDNFTYYVSAVDDGGNESAKSNWVSTWGSSMFKGRAGITENPLPETYDLAAAHPNPFNPAATIHYALPEPSQVQLVIYDLAGRTVATLVSGFVDAGYGGAVWQGRDESGRPVPTGVYIYRIVATGLESGERFTQTRKMVLLK